MAFWTLYKREISSYFLSTIIYLVLFASALSIGFYFTLTFNAMLERDYRQYTVLQGAVIGFFFWLMLIIQVPLVTMRAFSEEFKMGTIEMLLTAPVREWEVVLAKYLGALTFFLILWLPLLADVVIVHLVSGGKIQILWPATAVTFLGIGLFGMFYVAIGIFTSALTKNQIIASILCFAVIFFSFSLGFLSYLSQAEQIKNALGYFSGIEQMDNFARGLLDSRPIVFYTSGTIFFLFMTQRLLQARRNKA
jgi:ABC-2 type transport system permease protein